jgi:hypothetical protein
MALWLGQTWTPTPMVGIVGVLFRFQQRIQASPFRLPLAIYFAATFDGERRALSRAELLQNGFGHDLLYSPPIACLLRTAHDAAAPQSVCRQ